jgi:hypothetical protein
MRISILFTYQNKIKYEDRFDITCSVKQKDRFDRILSVLMVTCIPL